MLILALSAIMCYDKDIFPTAVIYVFTFNENGERGCTVAA